MDKDCNLILVSTACTHMYLPFICKFDIENASGIVCHIYLKLWDIITYYHTYKIQASPNL